MNAPDLRTTHAKAREIRKAKTDIQCTKILCDWIVDTFVDPGPCKHYSLTPSGRCVSCKEIVATVVMLNPEEM